MCSRDGRVRLGCAGAWAGVNVWHDGAPAYAIARKPRSTPARRLVRRLWWRGGGGPHPDVLSQRSALALARIQR